jgi:uncharacterized protein
MEQLYEIFAIKLRNLSLNFKRFLFYRVDWNNRLISIQGARGAGKTTLLLQYIKQQFDEPSKQVLYVDLNNIYFSTHSIIDLADQFYKAGGKFLFLDEIHKYQNWSVEIKQIYDTYGELKMVITGSSILEINRGEADLSRRLVSYLLPGLSFREYLELDQVSNFEPYDIESIVTNHMEIAADIAGKIRPMEHFGNYLTYGYYPFYIEGKDSYTEKLLNTINLILEVDLPAVESIGFNNIQKIKKLLSVVSQSVPFKPNTHKLAELTEVSRVSIIRFFYLLEKAQLLSLLQASTKGIQKMAKPDKIYLNNTNLMAAISPGIQDTGTKRETFFFNQLYHHHKIELPKEGDFLVNDRYIFEIGGKNKTLSQISGMTNALIAADNIEIGYDKKIPLWLFGFLY